MKVSQQDQLNRHTPRDHVRLMLSGKSSRHPIVDLGGRVASLSIPAYLDLKAFLGFGNQLESESVTMLNTAGTLDERILQRFGVPFRRLFLRPPGFFHFDIDANGCFKDEWGVTYRPSGPYNERIGHPLAEASIADLELFHWPEPHSSRVEGLAQEAKYLYENTGFSLVAGHVSAGIFQDCWNLRGMARFLEDMLANPTFAQALLERVAHTHIALWECFLDAVGPYIDIAETADDLGGQNGLLISPAMYRRLIKPYHTALHKTIHCKTRARILYHSCGAIEPLIDDLIETGVEILNPIQPLAHHMHPEVLARCYKDRLIFHGGLDVQSLLLTGTTQDVRCHVRRYFDEFGKDNYIMSPANSVQPGTPPENIVAAYDEAGRV